MKKNFFKINLIIFIFFLVFSLAFLGIAIGSLIYSQYFIKSAVKTTATITLILPDAEENKVFIEYIALNGNKYTSLLGSYNSNMYVGQKISIYYSLSNPNETLYLDGMNIFCYVFLGVGLFFLLGDIIYLIIFLNHKSLESLKETGHKIPGTIVKIIMNKNVSLNGRHPYKLVIKGCDGEIYKSKNIYDDISYLNERDRINIYLDEKHKKKFYVDYKK